jgi:hypothetical protein
LSLITLLLHTFMHQPKVSFMHFAMNNHKLFHTSRISGKIAAVAVFIGVVLMMLVVPWTSLNAFYHRGALTLDLWSGTWAFGELAESVRSPEAQTSHLALGLICGGGVMLLLTWLHASFLWWGLSPLGFIMSGTHSMNARIWTNAFIAWALVVVLHRFGGLKLYRTWRPVFIGMIVGHLVIMAVRSIIDPMLGLHMQLSPWA